MMNIKATKRKGEQEDSIADSLVSEKVFSVEVSDTNDSTIMQPQPLSPDSSGRPSRHKLRLDDMKILAGLMVRLTEVENEVISRLLHIAEEKGKETKQESTEVEVTPDKDSDGAPMIEIINIED